MPKVDVLCPSGMVALSEREHLELLESIAQRIEKAEAKWKRTRKDTDLADALDLVELYFKTDVESNDEIRAVRKKYPHKELVAELRGGCAHGKR